MLGIGDARMRRRWTLLSITHFHKVLRLWQEECPWLLSEKQPKVLQGPPVAFAGMQSKLLYQRVVRACKRRTGTYVLGIHL